MLAVIITAGMALLFAVGVWKLANTRLTGLDAKRTHLFSEDAVVFSRQDLRNPRRILDDRSKVWNAVVIAMEAVVLAVGVGLLVGVSTVPGIPVAFVVVGAATLAVGAALIGRAMYVRLGLFHPALETLSDYRDSLARSVDETVAEDFANIHSSLASARGEGVDEVTVGVLAAAKNGRDLDEVARWGEDAGVAAPEEFEARTETLARAGLVENDDGHLAVGEPLQGADEDQIATVAASVLN